MPFLLCPSKIRSGKQGEPCAIKYPLGWVVFGPVCRELSPTCNINFQQMKTYENISNETLFNKEENFKHTEFSDLENKNVSMSIEDNIAVSKMECTTIMKNESYRMVLPCKEKYSKLVNNISSAYPRQKIDKENLEKDSDLYEKYKKPITNYIYRKVNLEETCNSTTWSILVYLVMLLSYLTVKANSVAECGLTTLVLLVGAREESCCIYKRRQFTPVWQRCHDSLRLYGARTVFDRGKRPVTAVCNTHLS